MFKKIAAIVATSAMLVVGFTAMPASATSTSNAGAVKKTNWSLSWQTPNGETSTNPSSTISIQTGANSFNSYVTISLGADVAKAKAGHVLRIQWNEVFPSGVTWTNGQYGSAGVSKYVSASGSRGYWPSYSDLQIQSNSTDATDPANASLITIPANAANMTANQTIDFGLGLSFYQNGGNRPTVGNYTFAPTLFDKTAGSAISLSATAADANAWVNGKNYVQDGQDAFTGTVPAGGSLNQSLVTCVNKSSLVQGNVLTLERIVDGSAQSIPPYDYIGLRSKGTGTNVGNINPSYTIPADQVGANGKGFR
jgi:hypothetical protein